MQSICARFGVAALVVGAAVSGLVQAQTTGSFPVSAFCTGGVGVQLCNNVANVAVTTNTLLSAQYTANSIGCSNVRIHFLVDGTEKAVTGFVGPSVATGFFNLGPVAPGSHTVGLQAEGQTGGCNAGTLGSWGGTAQITTDSVAAAAVPTLSEWGLALLAAVLMVIGILQYRGNRRRA